jgi:hypothetical protein
MGLLSFAILLVSVVMLRSEFGRWTAYFGIGGGFFGVLSVTGWNLPVLLNAIGVTVWVFLISYRLYFRRTAPAPQPEPTQPMQAEKTAQAGATVEV